jgi:phosphoribosylaminoimidazole carboxylase / phosphoribosylaminoimidazole-succinocarboxamide synthase
VVRREAHGSYLKRNPHFSKGQLFPKLIVEFFLKTKNKNWKGKSLVCDDPLLIYQKEASQIQLFNPAKPIHEQEPFLVLSESEVFDYDEEWKIFPEIRRIARQAFLVLEKAWQLEGGTIVDLKFEFGFNSKGHLLLADVIDNDSWRVVESGSYIDKQVYRDGGSLDEVATKYRLVAEITNRFQLPRQRIVLWRGSEKDKTDAFSEMLGDLKSLMTVVTCSVHKEPTTAVNIFHRLIQEVPDSVVIAYIGRSNGAGPSLSAMSTVPHHGACQHQGVSRRCLVVFAGPEQCARYDCSGTFERCPGRSPNPLRPQSSPLRTCTRGDREPSDQHHPNLS